MSTLFHTPTTSAGLRHYLVVPTSLVHNEKVHTGCGLDRAPGVYATTLSFDDVTCPACRAYVVDLVLTRGRPVT